MQCYHGPFRYHAMVHCVIMPWAIALPCHGPLRYHAIVNCVTMPWSIVLPCHGPLRYHAMVHFVTMPWYIALPCHGPLRYHAWSIASPCHGPLRYHAMVHCLTMPWSTRHKNINRSFKRYAVRLLITIIGKFELSLHNICQLHPVSVLFLFSIIHHFEASLSYFNNVGWKSVKKIYWKCCRKISPTDCYKKMSSLHKKSK